MIVQIVPLSAAPNGPSVTGSKLRANLSTPPRFGVAVAGGVGDAGRASPRREERAGGGEGDAERKRLADERTAVELALEERHSRRFSS